MSAIETIQFNETGMVPAIAQDHITGEILMMAWMNKEALSLSIETQQAVYYSRSRQKLWFKGESRVIVKKSLKFLLTVIMMSSCLR